jgi:copper(I)-binding protein
MRLVKILEKSNMQNKPPYFLMVILVLMGLALAACQTASGPDITVENAWGRPSPKAATAGVFYMTLINNGGEADRLVSARSDSCGMVELHESYDMGDGVMGMRPVEGGFIEIPAKGQVELKMGGLHVMCIEKLDDFQAGAVLNVTLSFEKSGEQTVEVEIRQPDME